MYSFVSELFWQIIRENLLRILDQKNLSFFVNHNPTKSYSKKGNLFCMYYRLFWHTLRENFIAQIIYLMRFDVLKKINITRNHWIKHSFIVQYS